MKYLSPHFSPPGVNRGKPGKTGVTFLLTGSSWIFLPEGAHINMLKAPLRRVRPLWEKAQKK